jgi:DNA-binding response OmpR family regulator
MAQTRLRANSSTHSRRDPTHRPHEASAAARRELQVLVVLAEHAGRPVAKDDLYQRVWGSRVAGVKDRSLEVYVRRLRVKLAAASEDWDYIHTHRAIG